jgi:hypothetical protein
LRADRIAAYELTLRALDLVDLNDPLTTMIADKIVKIGATGLKDPAEISKRAVQLFSIHRWVARGCRLRLAPFLERQSGGWFGQ